MGKLKLNIDEIKVESFVTVVTTIVDKGTIFANMELPKTTQTAVTACETCGDSCVLTGVSCCSCPPGCPLV